jgi:hypothetical protein
VSDEPERQPRRPEPDEIAPVGEGGAVWLPVGLGGLIALALVFVPRLLF